MASSSSSFEDHLPSATTKPTRTSILRQSGPTTFYNDPIVENPSKSRSTLYKQHTIMNNSSKIEEEGDRGFECSICLGEYQDSGDGVPRSLLCGHTFCTGCLTEIVKDSAIICPKCKHVTPISCYGVAMTLVKNYGVLEIMCSHSSASIRTDFDPSSNSNFYSSASSNSILTMANLPQDATLPSSDVPICTTHGDRLTSFCVRDKVLVCSTCLLYGEHKDHPCQLVMNAGNEYRQSLKKMLPDVRTKTDQMKAAMVDIKKQIEDIQDCSSVLSDEVEAHFNSLIDVLQERKKELKLEVLLRSQERVEALVEQSCSLEEAIVSAEECQSSLQSLLSSNNHGLLQNYSSVRERILQLFVGTVPLEPLASNNLILKFPPESILEEFEGQFKHYGAVQSDVGTADNFHCDSFHDGFRIYWRNNNSFDSDNCSYSLQVASPPDNVYTLIYRGGDTKFTYRRDDLQYGVGYKFRVGIKSVDVVGGWCTPIECHRAKPSWCWDKRRRNIKMDISSDCLTVSSRHSSGTHWASVSGDKVFHHGIFYTEIEILDLAKHHIHKSWFTKIALGVIQCSDSSANDVPWQDGSSPIGLLTTNHTSSHQEHNSWGYVVTGGNKLSTICSLHEPYGQVVSLAVGDRIGMLVNVNEEEPSSISFFINGIDLGVAYSNLAPPLIPVLSVCDKFSVRLRFPPPPYIKRNASVTLLASLNATSD